MKQQLADLACRRRRLLETIEIQRIEVVEISIRWQKPVALVDAGLRVWGLLRKHPALVAGGLAALLALRRKGILGLAQTGGRLLFLYPSVIFFALKLFSSVTRPSGEENKTE